MAVFEYSLEESTAENSRYCGDKLLGLGEALRSLMPTASFESENLSVGILNRRKLIKTILSDLGSERPYFDFKETLDLSSLPGKARVIRQIAALANSNQKTPSFLIVGIEDGTREVRGIAPIDDVLLQQLVREYISPDLSVLYEIVPFPHSASSTKLGLLTIHASNTEVSIKRGIWKLRLGDRFVRAGSERVPVAPNQISRRHDYENECLSLLSQSLVDLQGMLSEFAHFYSCKGDAYNARHVVFHDRHVVCYSGWQDERFPSALSEVTVEFLTEGVSLFWSATKFATIVVERDRFVVCEQVLLFWEGEGKLYPFEQTVIRFLEEGTFDLIKEVVFEPPAVSAESIEKLINAYDLNTASQRDINCNVRFESERFEMLPSELLIAVLNGSSIARERLEHYLNDGADGSAAEAQVEALRILSVFEARVSREALQLTPTDNQLPT